MTNVVEVNSLHRFVQSLTSVPSETSRRIEVGTNVNKLRDWMRWGWVMRAMQLVAFLELPCRKGGNLSLLISIRAYNCLSPFHSIHLIILKQSVTQIGNSTTTKNATLVHMKLIGHKRNHTWYHFQMNVPVLSIGLTQSGQRALLHRFTQLRWLLRSLFKLECAPKTGDVELHRRWQMPIRWVTISYLNKNEFSSLTD